MVDLTGNRVIGGEKNEFCADLINEMTQLIYKSVEDARNLFQFKML